MSRKTRKLMWSVPLIAAVAVIGALALFMTLTPSSALAGHEELPGPVTGLKVEADGRNAMDLSWNAPTTGGDATHYRIDRSDDTYIWKALHVTSDNATTYTDTGLKPGRTYYYRAFAVNTSGTGPVSIEENYAFDTTASVTGPGTLRLVSAVAKSDKQIDLAWTAPSDNGGGKITMYCIVAASNRADYAVPTACTTLTDSAALTAINALLPSATNNAPQTIVVDAAEGTKYEHKGLSASTTVHYWVHAVNSAGMAPVASNPASATTHATPTLGPPPRNLRGVPVGVEFDGTTGDVNGGSVNLYWNIPTGTAPAATDTYTVEYSLNGRSGWLPATTAAHSDAFDDDPDGTQAAHSNVSAAVESQKALYYRIRVGTNRWSTAVKVNLVANYARPDSLAIGASAAPKSAAVDTLTASSAKYLTRIDLKWAFEADDYAEGTGTPVTPATPRPTGFLIDYFIGAADATNIYWEPLQSNTGYARGTYNHRNLKPAQMVHYRVFSWHKSNYGIPAAETGSTQAAVSPDPVRGLRATADGPTKIKLDWDAVPSANNGGSPITHYVIQVYDDQPDRPAGLSGWLNAGTSTGTTFTFSGVGPDPELDELTAEEGAWFRVIAVNAVNKGGYDADMFVMRDAIVADLVSAEPVRGETARADVPLAPEDLTTEPAKDSNSDFSEELGILLLWNAPDDPAGATVTGYTISRRVKLSGEEWSDWNDAWASITADDLLSTYDTDTDEPAEGEERQYRVLATSARGDSAWSNVADAPTMRDTHTPVVTEVGAATGVSTGPFNEGGVIQVNWDAAPNATGYIIYAVNVDELDDADGQIVVRAVNDASAETYNLDGLNSGDTYDIYVVATAKEMAEWPATDDVPQVEAN